MPLESSSEEMHLLLRTFYDCKVQYIIVGGFAVNRHGYRRTTGDIDLYLKDTPENRANLIRALSEMGYGDFDVLMHVPIIAGYCEIMMDQGMYADLMTDIPGLDKKNYDLYYDQAVIDLMDGYEIRYIDYRHLLENKIATNRPKDRLDVEELEKLGRKE